MTRKSYAKAGRKIARSSTSIKELSTKRSPPRQVTSLPSDREFQAVRTAQGAAADAIRVVIAKEARSYAEHWVDWLNGTEDASAYNPGDDPAKQAEKMFRVHFVEGRMTADCPAGWFAPITEREARLVFLWSFMDHVIAATHGVLREYRRRDARAHPRVLRRSLRPERRAAG